MKTTQIKITSITRMILLSTTMVAIASMYAKAQSSRQAVDESIKQRVKFWEDSVRRIKQKHVPVYWGGSLALSVPQYTLQSKLSALDGINVNYLGTDLGGVVANQVAKLRANVGMYYSGASVPYDMQMIQGSLSGNLYLLKLNSKVNHTFEPYVSAGVVHQITKFYGNYLPSENSTQGTTNNSSDQQSMLNVSQYNLMNIGAGVEYQLENNCDLFIHLFAEVNYGVMISSRASNSAFNQTVLSSPTVFSFGINFGVIK